MRYYSEVGLDVWRRNWAEVRPDADWPGGATEDDPRAAASRATLPPRPAFVLKYILEPVT